MPIDTSERPRMAATVPACRAVVAARRHAPERARTLLRRLRVRNFAGELLDEPATHAGAALDAGLDPSELERWMAEPEIEAALREDMAAARQPLSAARVLDEKLANWSGGRRYTCPSYEIVRLVRRRPHRRARASSRSRSTTSSSRTSTPGLDRREPPATVEEVLEWAGMPLATREVAEVCDLDRADARERLGRVARERHVGADGFWSLP